MPLSFSFNASKFCLCRPLLSSWAFCHHGSLAAPRSVSVSTFSFLDLSFSRKDVYSTCTKVYFLMFIGFKGLLLHLSSCGSISSVKPESDWMTRSLFFESQGLGLNRHDTVLAGMSNVTWFEESTRCSWISVNWKRPRVLLSVSHWAFTLKNVDINGWVAVRRWEDSGGFRCWIVVLGDR